MRARWLSLPASIAAVAATAAATAAAQAPPSPPIVLRWSAPTSCPAEAQVSARIERLLGGPPRPSDRRLQATGEVEATPQGYRLELTLASAEGGATESTRIVEGGSCDSLADAAALVIALAFDPEAVAAQERGRAEADAGAPDVDAGAAPDAAAPDRPVVPPPAPTELVRIPVPIPPAPSAPPSDPAVTLGAFASFRGDVGSLPDVAPGLRVGLSLGLSAFRIEPAFEAWPSSRQSLPDRPDAGANLRLLVFSLSACRRVLPWTLAEPGLSALACVGFEVGDLNGTGFGVSAPTSASSFWAAPRAELRGELPLGRGFALTADVGLAVPLIRRRFVLDLSAGRALVHVPSEVAGRAGVGVAVRF